MHRPQMTALLALMLLGLVLSACTVSPGASEMRIVAYYASWAAYNNVLLSQYDLSGLTHVNYAFANIMNGRCVLGDSFLDVRKPFPGDSRDVGSLRGNFHQIQLLREQYPDLKFLISVGGWTWSREFSNVALTEETRQEFVQSCIDLFIRGEFGGETGTHPGIFDGIDIDWEYPVRGGMSSNITRPEDRHNFTLLMAEFRRQLDELGEQDGRHYLTTVALGATPDRIEDLELPELVQYLDFINLMTYDFHGGWDTVTNFNAPLYFSSTDPSEHAAYLNTDAAVRGYLEAGVPPDRLVVGIPFYGKTWRGVPAENNGLYQPAEGPGPGDSGVLTYADIARAYEPDYERFWHDEAQVPWLYNGSIFITYDDPQSVAAKAAYVRENGLGGVMFWEITDDIRGVPAPENSLLRALYDTLLAPPPGK